MKFSNLLPAVLSLTSVLASPVELSASTDLATRADASLVAYLGVFFLGDAPNIYFYLSNGNNAFSFKALNKGNPILKPTLGTKGVRDPSIINGAGAEAGKKWYIIGTDLDIAYSDWNKAARTGSLKLFIWDSTDMVNWGNERLIQVENSNAGMAWAPDAIWDPAKGQYLVHWASCFYSASDTKHTGKAGPTMIRYAYTSDFKTFSTPNTFISPPHSAIIDLSLLKTGTNSYARFIKNSTADTVYYEHSDNGIFGTWTNPGGINGIVRSRVEGPYGYLDNVTPGKINLLLDYFSSDGYHPFYNTNENTNNWVDASRTNFPSHLRHGSVAGITQDKYTALNAKYGS